MIKIYKNESGLPVGSQLKGISHIYRIVEEKGRGDNNITYYAEASVGTPDGMEVRKFIIKEYFDRMNYERDSASGEKIKIKKGGWDNGFNRIRFVSMAALLKHTVRHPNICVVDEIFEANDTMYYSIEYVEGETLREFVRKRSRLTAHDALALLLPVMRCVAYLHSQNILHLDIKPDNIIIQRMESGRFRPVLIDFGQAYPYDEKGIQDFSWGRIGASKGYAPPEQIHGGARGLGPEADVYSLGATLLYCLAGENPPPSLQQRPWQMRESLESYIGEWEVGSIIRALTTDPTHRIHSVKELVDSLYSFKDVELQGAFPEEPTDIEREEATPTTPIFYRSSMIGSRRGTMYKVSDEFWKQMGSEVKKEFTPLVIEMDVEGRIIRISAKDYESVFSASAVEVVLDHLRKQLNPSGMEGAECGSCRCLSEEEMKHLQTYRGRVDNTLEAWGVPPLKHSGWCVSEDGKIFLFNSLYECPGSLRASIDYVAPLCIYNGESQDYGRVNSTPDRTYYSGFTPSTFGITLLNTVKTFLKEYSVSRLYKDKQFILGVRYLSWNAASQQQLVENIHVGSKVKPMKDREITIEGSLWDALEKGTTLLFQSDPRSYLDCLRIQHFLKEKSAVVRTLNPASLIALWAGNWKGAESSGVIRNDGWIYEYESEGGITRITHAEFDQEEEFRTRIHMYESILKGGALLSMSERGKIKDLSLVEIMPYYVWLVMTPFSWDSFVKGISLKVMEDMSKMAVLVKGGNPLPVEKEYKIPYEMLRNHGLSIKVGGESVGLPRYGCSIPEGEGYGLVKINIYSDMSMVICLTIEETQMMWNIGQLLLMDEYENWVCTRT